MKACNGGYWAKGNIHCHSDRSDGDSPPEAVADWYRSHGYDFLVITDHNTLTMLPDYQSEHSEFLLIPGVELSGGCGVQIDVNALGVTVPLSGVFGQTPAETVQRGVDLVIQAGGIPMIDHPNWLWALTHRDILPVERCNLIEIANVGSDTVNEGDYAHPPVEQVWDILLSAGRRYYGVASDDAHVYTTFPAVDNPGGGYIVARVPELTRESVLAAIREGRFYSSIGVDLEEWDTADEYLHVRAAREPGVSYLIRFIGPHGRILLEVDSPEAEYQFTGEDYVRAKVIASDGRAAWTQPMFA